GAYAEVPASLRVCHQCEPQRVAERAGDEGARRAILVGDHAREGTRETVDQVLDRERDGEGLPRPAQLERHGLQVQPEAVSRAEREREDDAAAQQDDERRPPIGLRNGRGGWIAHAAIVAERGWPPGVHLERHSCVTVDAGARDEGQYAPLPT